jgi:transposase
MSELARKYEVQPHQITSWKKDFLQGAEDVFEKGKPISEVNLKRRKIAYSRQSVNLKLRMIF